MTSRRDTEPDTQLDLDAVLRRWLARQVTALRTNDAGLREGSPVAVHRMRTATRCLRSALTTTAPILDEPLDDVRDELRWLGQALSPARDAHVIRERLEAALDAEPRGLVLGPARSRLGLELAREEEEGWGRALAALESDRYRRLVVALHALVEGQPLARDGRAPARLVLADLVRRDTRRLHRSIAAVADSDPLSRDAALHEVRKKAKRLRYAAELAAPVGGRRSTKLAKRAKAVQQALGRHQDSVVARERLLRFGAQTFGEGENGFTFGLLYAEEGRRADLAHQDFEEASRRLPPPRKAAAWVSKR